MILTVFYWTQDEESFGIWNHDSIFAFLTQYVNAKVLLFHPNSRLVLHQRQDNGMPNPIFKPVNFQLLQMTIWKLFSIKKPIHFLSPNTLFRA